MVGPKNTDDLPRPDCLAQAHAPTEHVVELQYDVEGSPTGIRRNFNLAPAQADYFIVASAARPADAGRLWCCRNYSSPSLEYCNEDLLCMLIQIANLSAISGLYNYPMVESLLRFWYWHTYPYVPTRPK